MSIGTGFLVYSIWNSVVNKINMIPDWIPKIIFGICFFGTFYYLSVLYEQAMESKFYLIKTIAKYKISEKKIREIIQKEKIEIKIPQFPTK